MLHLERKVTAIRQFLGSIHTAAVSTSWPDGIRDRVSRIFRILENKISPALSDHSQESETTRRASLPRFIVFSDTDNDLDSVNTTLRFAGILGDKSEIDENVEGLTILHTGDLVDKKEPDLAVVEFWQLMQQDALRKGGHVRLVAGNHEQEIWQRIHAGRSYGLDDDQAQKLKNFIENLDLFYVAGPVLFLHGYPTLEFLQVIAHFKEVTGKDLNRFNEDHYKKSFISVRAMKQYSYVRESRNKKHLLYDITDPSDYYRKKGRLIGNILENLGIRIVVHGHKPQRSGRQADYEFGNWIPNIRMVGNDTNVSRRGIGATVMREKPTGIFDIVFINSKTASDELRRKVQQSLGKSSALFETPSGIEGITGDHY